MQYNFLARGLFLMLLLAGCAKEIRAPVSEAAEGSYPADLRGAALYRVLGSESSLRVLVYRGGTLASLGHNHVLSSREVTGYVWRHADPARSGFDMVVPVESFIVDDDDARRAEGPDFPVNVSEEAKQGTRRNLLGSAVLDAEHFARIRVRSSEISGAPGAPQVTAELTIKGMAGRVVLPVSMQHEGTSLRVRGEFTLKQTDFGIKPYSVALGALQVQDELRIKFELVARPEG